MTIEQFAKKNILHCIGNTPIVSLQELCPDLSVNLFGKCEFLNPGGSIKDRIALHMINQAEKTGKLKPGGTIVEATSGNTGMGLAMVAANRGYKCIFVMADKQSMEKRLALEAFGAKVIICPTDVDPNDDRSYYRVAERIVKDTPNCFYSSQYENPDNPDAHYQLTGPEIFEQCQNSLQFLVAGIGTGGTISGISKFLREKQLKTQVVGVDPIGSIYHELFYQKRMGKAHSYLIEGIGEDFLPKTINIDCMDHVVQVNDEESFLMARKLVRRLGLLVGGSTGSAVLGAIKFFQENPQPKINGEKPNALVILVDSASRYLSKYLSNDWMKSNNFRLENDQTT